MYTTLKLQSNGFEVKLATFVKHIDNIICIAVAIISILNSREFDKGCQENLSKYIFRYLLKIESRGSRRVGSLA